MKKELIHINNNNFRKFMKSGQRIPGIYAWYSNDICIYVGASVCCEIRSTRIYCSGPDNTSTGKYIRNYISKHGIENIRIKIIPLEIKRLRHMDIFFFKLLQPVTMSVMSSYPKIYMKNNKVNYE